MYYYYESLGLVFSFLFLFFKDFVLVSYTRYEGVKLI